MLSYLSVRSTTATQSFQFAGIYDVHLRQFLGVLNAAAWLIICKRHSVHWLSIRQLVEYKLFMLVFNCLTPSYLSNVYHPGHRYHCLAVCSNLVVPVTRTLVARTVRYGPCRLAVVGPSIRFCLPLLLCNYHVPSSIYRWLKTKLLNRASH